MGSSRLITRESPLARRLAFCLGAAMKTSLNRSFAFPFVVIVCFVLLLPGCITQHTLRLVFEHSRPAVSPDGKVLLFVAWSNWTPGAAIQRGNGELEIITPPRGWGNLEICAVDATDPNALNDRRKWTNLTNDRAHDGLPAWSSDGSRIAFCSMRDGNSQVYVMKADGSDVKRLTVTPNAKSSPSWLPGDKKILFVTVPEISFSGQVKRRSQAFVISSDGGGSEEPWKTR
jgi:dipeptidyl aminopeptidase/acylaminoacyl peptidase